MFVGLSQKLFKYDSDNNTVAALYKLGLFVFVPLVFLFFYLQTDSAIEHLIKGGYSCSFRNATGLNCPGCGGTRASFYLARLRIIDSFKMNAAVPVSVALYLYFMIRETIHRLFGLKGIKEKQVYVFIAIFVVTVLTRWVISNFI